MSQASRAVALQNAVQLAIALSLDVDATEAAANRFNVFMNADEAPAATVVKAADTTLVKGTAAVAADKAAAKKAAPATTKKAPAKTEDEIVKEAIAKNAAAEAAAEAADDAASEEVALRERAGKVVADLLAANLRDKAIALFKKYGAKSVSSLPVDKIVEFCDAADELLMSV